MQLVFFSPDYVRQSFDLPKLREPNVYRKLERALLSGLPNEVDFALNICTLLSSEGRHSLKLAARPQIIDQLLACLGVYENGAPQSSFSASLKV